MLEYQKNFLNIDYLKNNCIIIHAFGLGFIQIKLNDNERVHVYSNKLSVTAEPEEIHNHKYSFSSYVLKGTLLSTIYEVRPIIYTTSLPQDFFVIQEVNCEPKSDDKETRVAIPVKPIETVEFYTVEGSSYYLHHNTFHKVKARDNTITYVHRTMSSINTPQVVRRYNKELVCPFSVNMSEQDLWEIVEEVLKS